MADPQEELLKKKLLEQRHEQMAAVQQQVTQQAASQQALQSQLKVAMMQILEPKARERLANLKVVKPDVAMQLELYLAQLYQSGQLREKITDAQIVQILEKIQQKREWNIKRK